MRVIARNDYIGSKTITGRGAVCRRAPAGSQRERAPMNLIAIRIYGLRYGDSTEPWARTRVAAAFLENCSCPSWYRLYIPRVAPGYNALANLEPAFCCRKPSNLVVSRVAFKQFAILRSSVGLCTHPGSSWPPIAALQWLLNEETSLEHYQPASIRRGTGFMTTAPCERVIFNKFYNSWRWKAFPPLGFQLFHVFLKLFFLWFQLIIAASISPGDPVFSPISISLFQRRILDF